MAWTALEFRVAGDRAEAWADALLEAGAVAVDVTDASAGTAAEVPQFGEPNEFAPGVWALNVLTALFDEEADAPAILATLAAERGWLAPVVFTLSRVEEQDWVRLTQSQFEPIRISSRLWILPSWHVAPDPDAINLVVDPGLAFGTGSHPTTRLCLQWLEAHLAGGESVLDYGCGSGILAIAAMKLGAASAIGVDIDPQAVEAARHNAAQNGVAIRFANTDVPLMAVVDITVANILANPLKVLAPLLASHTRAGGRLVLAGILDHQAEEIIAIYRDWFSLAVWRRDEGWSCIAGVRLGG